MDESEDLRTFMRELLLRFDRRMDRQSAERDRYFELLYEQGERENRRIDDLIAENRAQRQALLHILDRLDGNGGTAPA
jgi:hypothetical protein